MSQLMPLPLTVSCFSKIQIGFTFLVLAHLGSPGKRTVKWVCVLYCCGLQLEDGGSARRRVRLTQDEVSVLALHCLLSCETSTGT